MKEQIFFTKSFVLLNAKSFMQTELTSSESVSSDSLGELEVTGHDGNSLGVDGAQVGVFEEWDEVSLSSFLEGQNSGALES